MLHLKFILFLKLIYYFYFKNIYLFILTELDLSSSMQYLIPWQGIKPGFSELGPKSLSHWTTKEVLHLNFIV